MSDMKHIINNASKIIAEYWPLPHSVAVNPLWNLTDISMQAAMQTAPTISFTMSLDFYKSKFGSDISAATLYEATEVVLGKLSADEAKTWQTYLQNDDTFQASKQILYSQQIESYSYGKTFRKISQQCWELLADYFAATDKIAPDSSLLEFACSSYHKLHDLLDTKLKTEEKPTIVAKLLAELTIPEKIQELYLQQILLQVYGWASLCKWMHKFPDNHWLQQTADLEDLLIIWLGFELIEINTTKFPYKALCQQQQQQEQKLLTKLLIWQTAYELPFKKNLLQLLRGQRLNATTSNPQVQAVFCIDVRSEGLRRHLEQIPGYVTYGAAGFFGFTFKLQQATGDISLQSPAIINPEQHLTITATSTENQFSNTKQALTNAINSTKKTLIGPFVLFEMLGFWMLIKSVADTFAARGTKRLKRRLSKVPNKQQKYIELKHTAQQLDFDFACSAAHDFLCSIGLTENFAPQVVICAHQATTDNNPFNAALNCGACGGNSGVPNAIIACEVMNNSSVRKHLASRNIHIPAATQFIAACHNTVSDTVDFYTDTNPTQDTKKLTQDFNQAGSELYAERANYLPQHHSRKYAEADWAEILPEFGLANNAAMIIAPRWLSAKLDLHQRVFLHSYEPDQDENGDILANILAGPGIVAHWINAQYYFSTVCPERLGAGDKTTNNVIPGIGVISGNSSDLQIGIPQQSIEYRDQLLHEPRRLAIYVYAEQELLDKIIDGNDKLKQLIHGRWLDIYCITSSVA